MGTFDSHVDAPKKLKQEGETLEIFLERVDATNGTITWVIPPPADGCTSDNQAYNGIVIVANTVANGPSNWPVDGTVYTADPTVDTDLHAGDSIGGGLVVGAFYNDKTTTSLDVTGLIANTAYFFTGHVVDNVTRYHKQGMSTYSLPFLYLEPQNDVAAYQEAFFSDSVVGTTATGLKAGSPITTYTVKLTVDVFSTFTLSLRGSESQTYSELIDEINRAIKFTENPFQSAQAPNAGAYWFDSTTGKLFQWDGMQHNEIPLITETTDPTDIENGEYWLDVDDNNTLYIRSGGMWVEVTTVDAGFDPADPPADSLWSELNTSPLTPVRAWKWDGFVWCDRALFTQAKDPSCPPDLGASTYWFDENTSMLFEWNTTTSAWVQTEGIAWDVDPRNPTIGTFWFDDVENELFERTNSTTWTQRSVVVSSSQPSSALIDGTYWFDTVNQQLFVKQAGSPLWLPLDAIIWGADPTSTDSCDLWFDTSSSPQTLKVWDAVDIEWELVQSFTISATDPSLAKTISSGSVWAQTGGTGSPSQTIVYWEWDGSQFVLVDSSTIVEAVDDPTDVVIGDVWQDTTNNIFYERTSNTVWTAREVIESSQDPTLLDIGTFWYDSANNTLNMWNGATWINVAFSSTPLFPSSGTLWFDTTTETLYEWNSKSLQWEVSTPIAVATLNDSRGCNPKGNIIFTTTNLGSSGAILIGDTSITANLTTFIITSFETVGTLWDALNVNSVSLKPNMVGIDGLTGIPSYDTLGVGTDGSADERRELSDSIRIQLGYPTVEVELTKAQLDTAIQKSLEALRQRSASAYRRVYFFLDAKTGTQNYLMTNARVGFNKIVNVMGMWRITSAFMSTVHAAGVYGQTILQHLYHMGTYDLVSYHLISDYIEQLEQLFATRITYTFDEGSRELFIFQRFTRDEKILLDCIIERTEQELMTNRWTKKWIERWALGESKVILSQIRGKYANLPGAGGGVSLNANDLYASAQEDFARCDQEIDDFVVNDVENLGIGSEFIIG